VAGRIKVAFLWDGVSLHYGKRWLDGLWMALQHLKKDGFDIRYFEPNDTIGVFGFAPDVILYWGAFVETATKTIMQYPFKKLCCFAGGRITEDNSKGFDLIFVESKINEEELTALGRPWMRAFGVNEELYIPMDLPKEWDAIIYGTFAGWKRHDLFAPLRERGLAIGIKQEHEKWCYEMCEEYGVKVIDEQPRDKVVEYINRSRVALNTADYWGGGQRMTLEAMACNVPPVVMSDSPKNCEYVEESGYGIICDPNPVDILKAVEDAKKITKHTGREYIMSKWSSKIYAENLKKGILQVL